jgi:Ulp1 protease family, C-terminal catalytic domain
MENIFGIKQKANARPKVGPKKTRNRKRNRNKRTVKNPLRKKMNCSPIVEGKQAFPDTCFTPEVLLQIRDEYNKNHSTSNKITSNDPIIIWKTLKDRLQQCEKEDCWLKEIRDTGMRKHIDESIFSPDHPPEWDNNPNEWLSNIDILKVLEQYEKKYPHFLFLGPTPIDFDTKLPERNNTCVETEICGLSIQNEIDKKKTKIGIIFNLDKHDESGSHWVSLFIDLEHHFLFYFDSAGDTIPPEIMALVERIQKQGTQLSPPIYFKYYNNEGRRHQKGNTECGMYSLFFIITMLTSKKSGKRKYDTQRKMKLFKSGRISDKHMEKYRKKYFNHS